MKTIHKILLLSIFMLITNTNLYSNELTYSCDTCLYKEVILSDGLYSMKIGNCNVEVEYEFWRCGQPPHSLPTVYIKGITVKDCSGTPPTEQEIMEIANVQIMLYTHYWSGNPNYLPDNYDVQVKSPACYKLNQNGNIYEGTTTFTLGIPNCISCCSNTYTLDDVGSTVYVDNVINQSGTPESCTLGTICNFACSPDMIEEGDVAYYYQYNSCLGTDGITSKVISDELTVNHSPKIEYNLSTLFKDNGNNSYEITPVFVFNSNGSIDDSVKFAEMMKDVLKNRTTHYGVSASDTLYLKLKSCWQTMDYGQATKPCDDAECCYLRVEFQAPFFDIPVVTTSRPSQTCTTPCFSVCEELYDSLNNKKFFNLKPIFDENNEKGKVGLNIVPNPSSGLTNIELLTMVNGEVTIEILTTNGSKIATRKFTKSSDVGIYNLNTKTFANGVYFIKISMDGVNLTTKKLIIQN